MEEYHKIGSYICDDHFNSLKREREEFSQSPLISNCDFCDERATHWMTSSLSKSDFGEYNYRLRVEFFYKLGRMIDMLRNFSKQNKFADGLCEKEESELMVLVEELGKLSKEQ